MIQGLYISIGVSGYSALQLMWFYWFEGHHEILFGCVNDNLYNTVDLFSNICGGLRFGWEMQFT